MITGIIITCAIIAMLAFAGILTMVICKIKLENAMRTEIISIVIKEKHLTLN